MKSCPKCGAPIVGGANSCVRCGWEEEATLESGFGNLTSDGMTVQTTGRQALADVLGTRFQIVSKLGSGAFGEVYKAYDRTLDRNVAIKRIRLDALADETQVDEVKARFLREARVAAQLKHPNIVTIHDIVSTSTTSFIVMELIDGVTLQSVLQSKKRISLQESIDILSQAAEALDHAHQHKVVHRDVKPANIMIEGTGQVKVTDFGIAKAESSGNLTATGSILGTPNYMSPEQAQGEPLDGRSDLFSLGCILYECLTGLKPFQGESVTAILMRILTEDPTPIDYEMIGLSPALGSVMKRALAKNPDRRYSSGAELLISVRSIPSVYTNGATMDPGETRAILPPPTGTHRHSSAGETVPTTSPAANAKEPAAPVTIRRASHTPPPEKKTRPRWVMAALLMVAALVGSYWWTKRQPSEEAAGTPTQNAPTRESSTNDLSAAANEPTSSPVSGEPKVDDGPTKIQTDTVTTRSGRSPTSSPDPSPGNRPPQAPRTSEGPRASINAASPQSGPPDDESMPPKNIRDNEKAVVERLTRLAQIQARLKAERGHYATAQELSRGRRTIAYARLRGNQWTAQGYRFRLEVPKPDFYFAIAVPIKYGHSGIRSFYVDARGVLHGADKKGARATRSDPIW